MGLALACITSSIAEPVSREGTETRLVILHTNDLHGHITSWQGWQGDLANKKIGGFSRLATAVNAVRKKSEHVLLLDAGDAVSDTMVGMKTQGGVVIELMNALGYDAMTIGNHEMDFGTDRLRSLIRQANFPILAANIRERITGNLFTRPYVTRQLGALRVGILGIAYPNTPLTTAPENVADIEFDSPTLQGRKFIPQMLQEGANLIVVLSHLGLSADIQLAEAVPNIDVIVGGHSHNRMTKSKRVNNTLIVQAGAHGSDLGVLELTFEGTRRSASAYHLVTLDHEKIKADLNMADNLDGVIAPFWLSGNETIGKAGDWLVRAQTLAETEPRNRNQESPVDSLFADIIRETVRTDVVFLPGVGYGVAIPPGLITTKALKNLLPHESRLLVMELTGTQIQEILEQSIENVYTDDVTKKVGGMVQVSGLAFKYDFHRPFGDRLLSTSINGMPLNTDTFYRVVTNTLLAQGGHGYRTFQAASEQIDVGNQYEVIEIWLRLHPEVITPLPGRIQAHTDQLKPKSK